MHRRKYFHPILFIFIDLEFSIEKFSRVFVLSSALKFCIWKGKRSNAPTTLNFLQVSNYFALEIIWNSKLKNHMKLFFKKIPPKTPIGTGYPLAAHVSSTKSLPSWPEYSVYFGFGLFWRRTCSRKIGKGGKLLGYGLVWK